jgi:hypothetical protein
MVFEQSYMSARKWSLVVNSHLRVTVGHPFLAVGGLKGAPRAPVQEHVTPFNMAGHLPVALLFLSRRLAGAHKQSQSHVAEEQSYWRWKIARRCQLRRHAATVRLLCDAFFWTTRRRHSENFNEKLKLAGALNSAPAAWKKELLQYYSSSGAVRPPTEITKKHAVSAS